MPIVPGVPIRRVLGIVGLFCVLSACPKSEDTDTDTDSGSDTDTETDTDRVDIGWGTTDTCSSDNSGGFGTFWSQSSALLVHGSSEAGTALGQQVFEWYSPSMAGLELRSASDLQEEDRQKNLFIVGTPDDVPWITELNASLPAHFDEQGFTFGGYRYDEHAHGLALIHPNPWNSDRYVLLYAGNSVDGAYSLFTIFTGGYDFETTRGRGTVQQEGNLCRDGDQWKFYGAYSEDYRAPWETWVAGLNATEGTHHVFLYPPDSDVVDDLDWFPAWQEEKYQLVLSVLEVPALDEPIRTYLYPDNATKGQVTGNAGNGHANTLNFEVHGVYSDELAAVGAHEDVHVVAWHRIGDTSTALFGEGLAVMVDPSWQGQSLTHWASTYKSDGSIPTLRSLIFDFWATNSLISYPLAGHFVAYLQGRWGMDAVKQLYVADDLEAAFPQVVGQTLDAVESDWLASIP